MIFKKCSIPFKLWNSDYYFEKFLCWENGVLHWTPNMPNRWSWTPKHAKSIKNRNNFLGFKERLKLISRMVRFSSSCKLPSTTSLSLFKLQTTQFSKQYWWRNNQYWLGYIYQNMVWTEIVKKTLLLLFFTKINLSR